MRRSKRLVHASLALAAVICSARITGAQTADNVLLVVNESSETSLQVGDAYARKRSIAPDHVVHLKTSTGETLSRAEFSDSIAGPIGAWLTKHSLQDRILFVVLTKGVPLRIAGSGGLDGTGASVDSELTLLYRTMVGLATPVAGRIDNPYYLGDRPVAEAKPFSRTTSDLYLVTRLDGFSLADVLSLIDRATAPAQDGAIVLDQRAAAVDRGGNQWLELAADRLRVGGAAERVILESTAKLAQTDRPVLGYYSFGSNDSAYRVRHPGLTFVPGAIGGTFVSTDGRTFLEPPADWIPGPSQRPPGQFGNGSQSVAGDLIRAGLSGVSAHVDEPFLDATVRPQILFPAYLAGFNLAEAFYLAMPYLSWQTMIIGDPLCAPFENKERVNEPTAALDPATELPATFSQRRVATLARGGRNVEAIKLTLKADVHLQRGDRSSAEAMLSQAVQIDPALTGTLFQLAVFNEGRKEYDRAIARYREVIAIEPNHVLALNNLAYSLAVNQNRPTEALPLAERAFRGAPIAAVADTLGWIHHLLGNDPAARPFFEQIVKSPAVSVEALIHAATVFVGVKDFGRARTALESAERLDATINERPDVKAVRSAIK